MAFEPGSGPPQRQTFPSITTGERFFNAFAVVAAGNLVHYLKEAENYDPAAGPLLPQWKTHWRYVVDGWIESITNVAVASDLNLHIEVLDPGFAAGIGIPREVVATLPLLLDRRLWINNLQINAGNVQFRVANTTLADAYCRYWLRMRAV